MAFGGLGIDGIGSLLCSPRSPNIPHLYMIVQKCMYSIPRKRQILSIARMNNTACREPRCMLCCRQQRRKAGYGTMTDEQHEPKPHQQQVNDTLLKSFRRLSELDGQKSLLLCSTILPH